MLHSKKISFMPKLVTCTFTISLSLFNLFVAFDLLRRDVYGFRSFCKYFLQNTLVTLFHLSVYLSLQLSLFSQFKYNTGGKLDAANYITARAYVLSLSK